MMLPAEEVSWFGTGWLADRPPEEAWKFFSAAVGGGLVIILVSYCFTLVAIPPWRRAVLCLLRFGLWAGLCVVLAAPTRIERVYDRPTRTMRPLAVLVDRSGSMTEPDNRQRQRLEDALVQWRRVEPAAAKAFSEIKPFAFAQGLAPVTTLTEAPKLAADRTDLFASLQSVLAQAPAGGWGGVVVLTDGLDTSGTDVAEARRTAAQAALTMGTPLYFVVGRNRAIEPAFFHLREFNLPPRTTPHSVIRLNAVFESYQTAVSTVPLELTVSGNSRPASAVRLEAGHHLETWAGEGRADVPGTIVFELHAGTEMARGEVKVEEPPPNRLLYGTASLDWNYRFLGDILGRNDVFKITPVFDLPGLKVALPPDVLPQLPPAQDFKAFGVIMLENMAAGRLAADQQQALTTWVNEGGILLVVASDPAVTASYTGTELEKILPVVFRTSTGAPRDVPAGLVVAGRDGVRPVRAAKSVLTSFAWDSPTRVQEIFADTPEASLADETPKFATFAGIERAKPGAEVLARHPTEKGPDGRGAILLAVQRYGHGKTVVLATDALWRWRLSQSSASHGPELFWQNLLGWLFRDRDEGFYFDHPPVHGLIDQDVTLRLLGGKKAKSLHVEATLDGQKVPIAELPAENDTRLFRWRPDRKGFWQVEAKDEEGAVAHTWLNADEKTKVGELPAAASDETMLRSLAEQTSGAILGDVPAMWHQKLPPPQLLSEHHQPLWHEPLAFAALLGIYGLEMLLRRRWRLL